MGYKIIDAHMHPSFSADDSIEEAKAAGINFSMEGLLEDFDRHNIVKGVAIPDEVGDNFMFDNQKIKALVKDHPDVFIGVCTINPLKYKPEQMVSIERDIKAGIFKGIKLFPGYVHFYPSQKECYPIYELAQKYNIPVLFHTGDTADSQALLKFTQPLNIDEVAVSFPKVNFVICHLGNPWIMDAVEVLYKNKNVYAIVYQDIVGHCSSDRRSDAHRILWMHQ